MKLMTILFRHEWLLLRRSPFLMTSMLLFLLLAGYGIYYGRESTLLQRQKISVIADSVSRQQQRYRQTEDMPSLIRWNYSFVAANPPAAMAGLSLGQRDLYPYYYILNAQSLYVQTLKGDINNPFKLAAGSFDLAFVIVYLLPLLIIAFTFDCLSAEKDRGTDSLLLTQPVKLRKIVLGRMLFRFLVIGGLVILVSVTGVIAMGAALGVYGRHAVLWLAISLLYTACWYALIFALITLRRSTAFNAVAAIGAWMVVLIVIPSLINLAVSAGRPVAATALAGLMRSRSMPETDEATKRALDEFYRYHPELGPLDTARSPWFYFQGYSAFLALNDRYDDQQVEAFYAAVRERNSIVRRLAWINPAVNTQSLFNLLAGTSLDDELAFREAVRGFHNGIFWFSNRPLFAGRKMTSLDYSHQPLFQPAARPLAYRQLITGVSFLLLLTMLLAGWGWRRLRETAGRVQ